MCHGVMKMSKFLKKISVLKILHSQSAVHLGSQTFSPPPPPEHISYANNSVRSWGFGLIVYSLCPQWADRSSWEAWTDAQHIEYMIPTRSSINIRLLNECWLYGNYQDRRKIYIPSSRLRKDFLAKVKPSKKVKTLRLKEQLK